MIRTYCALLVVSLLPLAYSLAAEGDAESKPDPAVPPIKALAGAAPKEGAFAGRAAEPVVIRSAAQVDEHFDKDAAAKIKAAVDFEHQVVLLFAWRGSGRDTLEHTVAESYPEQVRFTYKRGLTRDLRPHAHVYALRSNVTWSVAESR